jgi:NAD(P)-dependent dehydrogenase (short-subunit alcohol dehydrogenase family)
VTKGTTVGFEGATAIVTGGASGIGGRVTERLHEAGAQVVVGDWNQDSLDAIAQLGDRIHPVRIDVREEADIERMVAVARDLGGLKLAVNAAGIGEGTQIVDQDLETWNKVLGVVLTGVFLAVKHEARELIRLGDGGAIVNVASINSNIPTWGSGAYSAAKSGVEMLTRTSAYELAEHGIRVTCVSPGLVDTPMAARTGNMTPQHIERWMEHTPLGRVGTPDDIASAILYLGSDEATWVTGHNLVVDGGLTHTAGPVTRDLG